MVKLCHSEKKTSKILKKRRNKNKRWASKENKRRNKPDKESSKYKKLFDFFSEPTIEEQINSLDSPLINEFLLNNSSELKIKFPSEINNRKFSELFSKGINFAKVNFSQKNLKVLKKLLLMLNEVKGNDTIGDEFGLDSCPNNLHKIFRKDLILTLLSDEKKLSKLGKEGLKKVQENFKKTKEYNLFVNNSVYSNCILFNENSNGLYSFNEFKNIIFSPVVLQAYKEVLNELYGVQLSSKEIKEIIKDFLNKHSIYFVLMNIEYYGLILYDGTILINKIYYVSNTDKDAFIILFTLLQEIMHALSRIVRGDDNYLLNTDKFTKRNIIFCEESGIFFENKLLYSVLKAKELTSIEATYLLKKANYEYKTIVEFHKAFIDFKNKNIKKINSLIPFSIGKESNNDSFIINFGCYCAGSRMNDKKL